MIENAILTGELWVTVAGQVLIAVGVGTILALIRGRRTRSCRRCGGVRNHRAASQAPAVPPAAQPLSAPVSPAGQVYLSDQTRVIPVVDAVSTPHARWGGR